MNWDIRAPQVRVIDGDGGILGVYQVPDAIRIAQDKGLDLIEVAPNSTPPTCKLMDYGKYKYEQKKKAHESRKNQVQVTVKEIQLSVRTDQHDLDTKLKHARRFLEDGDKVKFNLRFRGREAAYHEIGQKALQKVIDALADISIIEQAPKLEGKQLFLQLAPDHVKIKLLNKNKPKAPKEVAEKPAKVEKPEKED